MTLSARKINKSIGGKAILTDCSFDLKEGECLILRGPSGGGKSTLLRILSLLEAADSGAIIHGNTQWDAAFSRKVSAYPFLTLVFQQLFLWPNLTNAQNISLVLDHKPSHTLPSVVEDMLGRLSIQGLMQKYPHECSLGERQRVALARALVSPAKFLLLDEPSSALDSANKSVLVKELKEALERGRGALVVTHDFSVYSSIATQSFELENSRLRDLRNPADTSDADT